jgi:hypothetical protein
MNDIILSKKSTKGIKKSKKRILYKQYKKILKENKVFLYKKHNIRIDWINRMWKVYNVPIDEQHNIYHYGSKYLNELIKKDLTSIDKTFMTIGLLEISALIETVMIDEYNVKIVISYKHFDLLKRANRRLIFFSSIFISVIIFSILFVIL